MLLMSLHSSFTLFFVRLLTAALPNHDGNDDDYDNEANEETHEKSDVLLNPSHGSVGAFHLDSESTVQHSSKTSSVSNDNSEWSLGISIRR